MGNHEGGVCSMGKPRTFSSTDLRSSRSNVSAALRTKPALHGSPCDG